MGRALSLDLRERMMAAFSGGMSRRAVARRFDVSPSCMVKLVQHQERTGGLEPKTPTRRKPYALAAHEKLVRALVAAQPDMTLDELQAALAAHAVVVSRSAVNRYLKALDLTLKKSRSGRPSRTARTSPRLVKAGARTKPISTRPSSSSSTRRG